MSMPWSRETCNISLSQQHSWQTRHKLLQAALPTQLKPCSSAADSRMPGPANHPFCAVNKPKKVIS